MVLSEKVIKYLESKGKTVEEVHPLQNVIMQNDGDGDYILKWDVTGVPQPSQSELDAMDGN